MISERLKVHVGLAAALTVLISCISMLVAGTLHRGDPNAGLAGSVAPDFVLRDADNVPVALSELRGNVVIVYFQGKQTDDSSAFPTSAPTDLLAASSATPGDAAQTRLTSSPLSLSNPSLAPASELSAMCRELNNSRLKVIEMENPEGVAKADSFSNESPANNKAVQKLVDATGDVAREYRIDSSESKPTFFVIDPTGIIRYRGNSLGTPDSALTSAAIVPATQPFNCPEIVQTLLSTQDASLPLANRF